MPSILPSNRGLKRFGSGRALGPKENAEAVKQKRAGPSDRHVAVRTGVNRATVAKPWLGGGTPQQSLEGLAKKHLLKNLETIETSLLHSLLTKVQKITLSQKDSTGTTARKVGKYWSKERTKLPPAHRNRQRRQNLDERESKHSKDGLICGCPASKLCRRSQGRRFSRMAPAIP